MSYTLLKYVLLAGKMCGMVPLKPHNVKLHLVQTIFLSVLHLTLNAFVLYLRINNFASTNTNIISFILQLMQKICLNLFAVLTILVPFFKRRDWYSLLTSLQSLKRAKISNGLWCMKTFAFDAFYFWFSLLFYISAMVNSDGPNHLALFGVEYLQNFLIFLQVRIMVSILAVLKHKYKYLLAQLKKKLINPYDFSGDSKLGFCLDKIKRNLLSVKEDVDTFNAIFGWSILNILFIGVLIPLNAIFGNVVSTDTKTQNSTVGTVASINMVIMFCSQIVIMIFTFDSFALHFDNIKEFVFEKAVELEGEVKEFADDIVKLYPSFDAAGFVSLKRSTLFSFFNCIITFLVVVIQFQISI